MAHSDTHRRMHDLFNSRRFDEIEPHLAPGFMYEDLSQGLTIKTSGEFIDYLKGWVAAFSDGNIGSATYLDGPDFSVATYHGRGTHDGQFGPIPATGRTVDQPWCEVLHFGSDGLVLQGESYYDQAGIMRQLGLLPDPDAVAAQEGLEPAVRRIMTAFDSLDLEAATAMMTADAQGVDEISRKWVRGGEAIADYFRSLQGQVSDVRSEIVDLTESTHGDTGVASFWLEQDYTMDGERRHVSAPTTMVLRREAGDWKVALVHSVPLPEE
jgi:ketosteroid isomerase-like protein/predicted ester cyclase